MLEVNITIRVRRFYDNLAAVSTIVAAIYTFIFNAKDIGAALFLQGQTCRREDAAAYAGDDRDNSVRWTGHQNPLSNFNPA